MGRSAAEAYSISTGAQGHWAKTESVKFKMPIRSITLLITCCFIAALLYFTALMIFAFTTRIYPFGALWYVPWSFGLCGLFGLISDLRNPESKKSLWHKTDIVLLALCLVGELCFLLIYVLFVVVNDADLLDLATGLYAIVLVCCLLLPTVFAIKGVQRARAALQSQQAMNRQQYRKMLLLIVCLVCAAPASQVLTYEVAILWYGRNLATAVNASAHDIAGDAPYCFRDRHGTGAIEALNTRQLLLDAIDKRFGFHGMNYVGTDPHFGIQVNGEEYWWSFKSRQFHAFPGKGGNFRHWFRNCAEP
jgi:hypothetical protein